MIIKKIKPMFNSIVTTMNKYEHNIKVGNLIDSTKQKGSLKEYQTVLAVGPYIKDIKVGDVVFVNPTRFAVKKHKEGSLRDGVITDNPVVTYNFDVIKIDGNDCLLLQDRDVDFIVEEFEEEEEVIEDDNINLILPEEKKIII